MAIERQKVRSEELFLPSEGRPEIYQPQSWPPFLFSIHPKKGKGSRGSFKLLH